MNHLEFDSNGLRFCLTGTIITVYGSDGVKVRQYFYDSKWEARRVFMAIYDKE